MRKYIIAIVIIVFMLLNQTFVYSEVEGSNQPIKVDSLKNGLVKAQYNTGRDKNLKFMVEKDGVRYTYDLNNSNNYESFPLQLGDGDYKLSILENIEGIKYKYLITREIYVNEDVNSVFLNSIQMIRWDKDSAAIKKAKVLTAGIKNDNEKIEILRNYIVNNISYDYVKAANLNSGYLPDNDKTLKDGKGICYDFASLYAAMLRSQCIPTKLAMGYTDGVSEYHAWNEVYDKNTDEWHLIDTTYDSVLKNTKKADIYKDKSKYKKDREY